MNLDHYKWKTKKGVEMWIWEMSDSHLENAIHLVENPGTESVYIEDYGVVHREANFRREKLEYLKTEHYLRIRNKEKTA